MWVVELNPEPRVELDALASGPLATIAGVSAWETRPEANAALCRYREAKEREALLEAGQGDLWG